MWDGKAAADGSGAESVPSIAVSLLESGETTTSIGASECVALDTELAIRWRETQLSRRARGKELQVPGVVSRVADAAGSGMIAMRRRASIGLGLPGWGMGAGEYMPKKQRHDP